MVKKRNEAGADAAALECQGICETVHWGRSTGWIEKEVPYGTPADQHGNPGAERDSGNGDIASAEGDRGGEEAEGAGGYGHAEGTSGLDPGEAALRSPRRRLKGGDRAAGQCEWPGRASCLWDGTPWAKTPEACAGSTWIVASGRYRRRWSIRWRTSVAIACPSLTDRPPLTARFTSAYIRGPAQRTRTFATSTP